MKMFQIKTEDDAMDRKAYYQKSETAPSAVRTGLIFGADRHSLIAKELCR